MKHGGTVTALCYYLFSFCPLVVWPTPSFRRNSFLGKPATANPGEWSANQANDGDLETRWATGNDQYPAWWQVDLGAQYDLTRLEIHWYGQEARAYRYKVEVGATGADFAVVFDQLDNTTFGPTDASLNVRGRYVRITLEGAHPGGWPSPMRFLFTVLLWKTENWIWKPCGRRRGTGSLRRGGLPRRTRRVSRGPRQ